MNKAFENIMYSLWVVNPRSRDMRRCTEDSYKLAKRLFETRHKVGAIPDQTKAAYKGLNECWVWTGCCNKRGYGVTKILGKQVRAHRLSWIVHFGVIKEGLLILHRCDNPMCVNPHHLFMGDSQVNSVDRETKNRGANRKGVKNNNVVLSETQVREIRHLRKQGYTMQRLADQFCVSQANICLIVNRKQWTHIPEEWI